MLKWLAVILRCLRNIHRFSNQSYSKYSGRGIDKHSEKQGRNKLSPEEKIKRGKSWNILGFCTHLCYFMFKIPLFYNNINFTKEQLRKRHKNKEEISIWEFIYSGKKLNQNIYCCFHSILLNIDNLRQSSTI